MVFSDIQDFYNNLTSNNLQASKSFNVIVQNIATPPTIVIPHWIKSDALWWYQGTIDDDTFVSAIQWMIQNGAIKISPTENSSPSQNIPSWVKNDAGWWAQGQISDDEFVRSIDYLIQSGIIQISQ